METNAACTRCQKIAVKLYKYYKYNTTEPGLPLIGQNNTYCKRCLDNTATSYKNYTVEYDEQAMTYAFVDSEHNMELVGAEPRKTI